MDAGSGEAVTILAVDHGVYSLVERAFSVE
jgi:hypothetical protein